MKSVIRNILSRVVVVPLLVIYILFLDRTGDILYAQLALTYTLIVCGLGLVVFVRLVGSHLPGASFQATTFGGGS